MFDETDEVLMSPELRDQILAEKREATIEKSKRIHIQKTKSKEEKKGRRRFQQLKVKCKIICVRENGDIFGLVELNKI